MTDGEDVASTGESINRAFGAENRDRLITDYFSNVAPEEVTSESAWRHTYRLLMWIDRTIGLAHCYESDKCQPGRPWYARSLAFHAWLATELGSTPSDLADEIDWLFSTASSDLARTAQSRARLLREASESQRAPYDHLDMPTPGEDPELEDIIAATLRDESDVRDPSPELVRLLSERIQVYMGSENKRKNLVGEGFEDTLAQTLRRIPSVADLYEVHVRPPLHELPDFYPPRGNEKVKKVDLALVRRSDNRRVLVSCKWSVRSDREEQFRTDFAHYSRQESSGTGFDYVLLTNEFDPARLDRACSSLDSNQFLFGDVVHVNPMGPLAAYDAPIRSSDKGGLARTREHIASGRLTGLQGWIDNLSR